MPKPRKYELINFQHFAWRLTRRDGVYYADGRSNQVNAGRHSLGTRDRDEAQRLLAELDIQRAADLGKIPRPQQPAITERPLPLVEGRRLYEERLALPFVTGGVRKSTRSRYRTVLDKFLKFAPTIGVETWNRVNRKVLEQYTEHLVSSGYQTPTGNRKEYRHKTLHNELVNLKTIMNWLVAEGYLGATEKINMPLKKAESERPHCWTIEEVAAIIKHCGTGELKWLGEVCIGLACTGLRIGELGSLRWSDVDLDQQHIHLTDETAHSERSGHIRRQTKSGRSRDFPIHEDLFELLKRMPQKDKYVFHGPRGGKIKADTVRNVLIGKVLTPLAERFPAPLGAKGFKDGRLHSFRHYFCSRHANSGTPEQMVMEWLGHADSAMVRHYYHLNNQEARRQMQRADLLGEAGKRFAGNNIGTAIQKLEDSPGRESSAAIAT